MAAHLYWRLYITGAANLSIAEWKLYDVSSTQIPTTGGSGSSNDQSFGATSNAFDANASTFWAPHNPPTPGSPAYLEYQFATPVDVSYYSVATRNDSLFTDGPTDLDLQYSDNGSTWTTLLSHRGVGWSSAGQVITLNAANALPAFGVAWRLYVTAAGIGAIVGIKELTFFDPSGSPLTTSAFAAYASSTFYSSSGGTGAYNAFDGSATSYWNASNTDSLPEWLAYRFASAGTSIGSFSLRGGGGGGTTPSTFKVQYSFDDVTWIDAGGPWTAGNWSTNPVQTFVLDTTAIPQIWILM